MSDLDIETKMKWSRQNNTITKQQKLTVAESKELSKLEEQVEEYNEWVEEMNDYKEIKDELDEWEFAETRWKSAENYKRLMEQFIEMYPSKQPLLIKITKRINELKAMRIE